MTAQSPPQARLARHAQNTLSCPPYCKYRDINNMDMAQTINNELQRISEQYDVHIIWACESGSRAWGFPSSNSDYDVRFIYAHRPKHYIRVFECRDVIEEPINDQLELRGCDIKKALSLLRKSNPALMSWLSSPIIYQQNIAAIQPLLDLSKEAFLPSTAAHHYLSEARQDMQKLAEDRDLRLKKYLYMLRALFSCQWVIERHTQPPLRFQELLDVFLPTGDIREQVDELLQLKMQVLDSEIIPPNPDINDYLLALYGQIYHRLPQRSTAISPEACDHCLHLTLQKLWPDFHF